VTALLLLAQDETPKPDDVTAGWTGLIVLLLLAGATVFLLRSMNRRLKGIDFDEEETPRRDEPQDPRDG
jgi:hypothetical protein